MCHVISGRVCYPLWLVPAFVARCHLPAFPPLSGAQGWNPGKTFLESVRCRDTVSGLVRPFTTGIALPKVYLPNSGRLGSPLSDALLSALPYFTIFFLFSRLTAQWVGLHHSTFDPEKRKKFEKLFWIINACMLILVVLCYAGALGAIPGNQEAWAIWGALCMCLLSSAG